MITFLWCFWCFMFGLWFRPIADALYVVFENAWENYMIYKNNKDNYEDKNNV